MTLENQHQKISGYRDLQQHEIDLMNKIKDHAVAGEALIARVSAHLAANRDAIERYPSVADAKIDRDRMAKAEPHRWLAIARTDLQTANMALVRAVAQPTTF
jgi:hypothetical protein